VSFCLSIIYIIHKNKINLVQKRPVSCILIGEGKKYISQNHLFFMKFLNKNKKRISTLLGIVLCLFFVPTNFALACNAWLIAIPGACEAADSLVSLIATLTANIFVNLIWLVVIVAVLIGLIKLFLWASVWLLGKSLELFVVGLNTWLNLTAITAGWTVVRDLSNMIFIFILIYIAVNTILSLGDYKKQLSLVLIMAVLVNFSMAFTKVAIDTSNIFTIAAYNKMTGPVAAGGTGGQNLGWFILDSMHKNGTDSIMGDLNGSEAAVKGSATAASSTGEIMKDVAKDYLSSMTLVFGFIFSPITKTLEWVQNQILDVIPSLFMIYLFTFIACVFVFRFVTLVFLIVTSPAAIASYAWPKLRGQIWDPWYKELVEQLLIAPVLIFCLYIVVSIVGSNGFQTEATGAGAIIKYMLILGFLAGSIKAAKAAASGVSGLAEKVTKNVSGKAAGITAGATAITARNTAGRSAEAYAEKNKEKLASMRQSRNIFTRGMGYGLTGVTDWGKKSSMDLRNTDMGKSQFKSRFGGSGTDILNSKLKKKPAGFVALRDARAEKIKEQGSKDLDTLEAGHLKQVEELKKEVAANTPSAIISSQKKVIDELREERKKTSESLTQAKMSGASTAEIENLRKEALKKSQQIRDVESLSPSVTLPEKIAKLEQEKTKAENALEKAKAGGANENEMDELRKITLETAKEIKEAQKDLHEVTSNMNKTISHKYTQLKEREGELNGPNSVYQEAKDNVEHYSEHAIFNGTRKGMSGALKKHGLSPDDKKDLETAKKENELKETVKKLEEEVDNLKNK
jgi:hypothetical protein